jgi:hypothetical protein
LASNLFGSLLRIRLLGLIEDGYKLGHETQENHYWPQRQAEKSKSECLGIDGHDEKTDQDGENSSYHDHIIDFRESKLIF